MKYYQYVTAKEKYCSHALDEALRSLTETNSE